MNADKMSVSKAVLMIALLGLPALLAGDEVPRDLQQMLDQHHEQRLEGITRLNSAYIERLQVLKRQYTSQGNLEAAVAVREAIAELAAEIEALRTASRDPDPDEKLRDYLLSQPFEMYFAPPRSKLVTFLPNGSIGEGGNSSEHFWEVVEGELAILSAEKVVGFLFSYDEESGRLNASETPHRYESRQAYLVPAQ